MITCQWVCYRFDGFSHVEGETIHRLMRTEIRVMTDHEMTIGSG